MGFVVRWVGGYVHLLMKDEFHRVGGYAHRLIELPENPKELKTETSD